MPSIRYLALGDSYTIGTSVDELERWPNQLAEQLRTEDLKTDVSLIAHDGWTTQELWQGIQNENPAPPYDLVSLLIGVNNQYRGYDIEDYREEFRFLLGKSIEYAGGVIARVFVVSIPDWGVTPFAEGRDREKITREIDLFNKINEQESLRAGVPYVNVTPVSRQAAGDPSLIAADGLHPAGAMYKLWVAQILPVVLPRLK
ncbi:MAG: SGNH/GDSL hydrolase family protein [Chloroflexi bacterium]|nr:SGNH/GDSL hydrolase family protein [Chloroflexota bacterium]